MLSRQRLLGLASFLVLILIGGAIWFFYPRNRVVTGNYFEGVIFHKKYTADVLGVMLLNDKVDEAYWVPTRTDITTMEEQFSLQVQDKLPLLASRLSSYKRQYYGFFRDGRQQIFIVGFCEPVTVDWRKELVSLAEAAECYFEAQYDVSSGEFLYAWARPDG